jgi:hypothetical protein
MNTEKCPLRGSSSQMRPPNWNPTISLSLAEQTVLQKIRQGKLFVFLRQFRHEIFDEEFQEQLETVPKINLKTKLKT